MKFLESVWSKHYAKCLIVCYWIFGLCNNFAYVVMLSAAHDILSEHSTTNNTNTTTNETNKYDCNKLSTGIILLFDIVPGFLAQLITPFFVHRIKYQFRIGLVVFGNIASFLLVALSPDSMQWLTFIGVVFASLSVSFGEITFLSLSTFYNRVQALSGWGSGTGAAGIGGSFGYAGLTSAGLSPRNAILSMLFVPFLMGLSYLMLPPPVKKTSVEDGHSDTKPIVNEDNTVPSINRDDENENKKAQFNKQNILAKVKIVRTLLKYMIPLFLVYFAEYFINQGLYELLYFNNESFLKSHKEQYRWYNVCYQVAVFVSRTSISLFEIKFLPIFPILQILNIGILMTQIFFNYIPSIWIIFVIIFWEGLLGGGCYVNAFNMVSREVPEGIREFAIAITAVGETFGISLAGFSSIPVHNAICDYGKKK